MSADQKSVDQVMQESCYNAIAQHNSFFANTARPYLAEAMRLIQQALKDNNYAIIPIDCVKSDVKLNELNQVETSNV